MIHELQIMYELTIILTFCLYKIKFEFTLIELIKETIS